MSDPVKCLAAAHLPLHKRACKANDTWFERVNALADEIRAREVAAVKAERERVLALLREFSGVCDRYGTARNTLEAAESYITARSAERDRAGP